MQDIRWRDEKLYRISAQDYGGSLRRACGAFVHSIAKGAAIGLVITVLLSSPRMFSSFRTWLFLFLPLTLICSIWVAVTDRNDYICQIEIQPDRVIRYSRAKAVGIERDRVREIAEGVRWTMFSRVDGITIKGKKDIEGKKNTIFVPGKCRDYAEIKSKLNSWHPDDS